MNTASGGYGPELEEHRQILYRLAERSSSEFVNCDSIEKKILMIERMLVRAKDKVYILTDHLDADLWGHCDIIDSAYEFLRKENSQLKIVAQFNRKKEDALFNSIFLRNLKDFKDRIYIYKAGSKLRSDFRYHFVVVDDRNGKHPFIYEFDSMDNRTTGSFNREEISQKLIMFFDKALDSIETERIDNSNLFKEIDDIFWGRKRR